MWRIRLWRGMSSPQKPRRHTAALCRLCLSRISGGEMPLRHRRLNMKEKPISFTHPFHFGAFR